MNERMLLQLDTLALIHTNNVATCTLPLIAIMQAVIFHDSLFPAMPQLALTDLDVFEYIGIALGTL